MESHVDPFLVEALQNPRHRLTILRMELDIQNFLHGSNQHRFEFQQFPTSYLRCVAHRVAQHYGLQTFSIDNIMDSLNTFSSKIIAVKTLDSKFPAMCLSEVPAKYTETGVTDQVKIAIRKRPSITSLTDVTELENRKCSVRSVEERKEEYDKARARIFNSSTFADSNDSASMTLVDRRGFSSSRDELDCFIISDNENEKARAIFRDRKKDRWDPDYDRSYNRYVKGQALGQNLALDAGNYMHPSILQYEACSQIGLPYPKNQTPVAYRETNPASYTPCAFGCNGFPSMNAVYPMPFLGPAMMYTQTYGHFRHATFQAPGYQHSPSFGYLPNC